MASLNPDNKHFTKLMIFTMIFRFLLWIILLPLSLFWAAGRLDWAMGWAYIISIMLITIGGRFWVLSRFPALLEERVSALDRADSKAWDKILVPLVALLGPFVQVFVAGLDERFSWSPTFPLGLEIFGLLLMIAAYCFATWPMLVNPFFSSAVRIQHERGHYVISTGPYAIVRHPSYLGSLIGTLGASLALASWWSLLASLPFIALTILRTKLEDDTLQAELTGYQDYTQKTRYRLFPYIW